jgi:N-acetylglucosaminylphosphatidylinositol deacetylase
VAYALQTKFVLRKYLSLADLVPTSFPFTLRILEALLMPLPKGYEAPVGPGSGTNMAPPKNGDAYGDKALIVTDWGRHLRAQTALGEHVSEYSWDRVLYSVLSRYMWFNDLRRM